MPREDVVCSVELRLFYLLRANVTCLYSSAFDNYVTSNQVPQPVTLLTRAAADHSNNGGDGDVSLIEEYNVVTIGNVKEHMDKATSFKTVLTASSNSPKEERLGWVPPANSVNMDELSGSAV